MTATSPEKKSVLTKFVHPFIVVRDAIRRRFVLRRRKPKPGENDPRVVKRSINRPNDGSVPLSAQEKKIRLCTGSQNLWHECEDRLCNKYWLNDATGEKVNKKPKAATIVQLMIPKDEDGFEKRVLYLRTRPSMDYATYARQLLILSENESIQRVRADAANIGARQLEHAAIHNVQDLLALCGLTHWEEVFQSEGIDLSTAFFLKDSDMSELGMVLGERIRLTQVLECMRKIEVIKKAGDEAGGVQARNTKFIKGDIVEHLKESENLIRKGKIVGVHADDIAAGVYYTVALENEGGYEVQSAERKLEFPGIWEKVLRDKGIEPIFKEPGGDEDYNNQQASEEQIADQQQEEHIETEPTTTEGNTLEESTLVEGEQTVDEIQEAVIEEHTEYEAADISRSESAVSQGTSAVSEGEEDDAEGYTGRAPPPLPPAFGDAVNQTPNETVAEEEQVEIPEQQEQAQFSSAHEEYPMYVGMSRYSTNYSQPQPETHENDDRKESEISLVQTVELEEMGEDEPSGMAIPPPPAPNQSPHRPSSGSLHRESLYSLEPTMELIEMDEETETSGMAAPPPPIPHRASSVHSEQLMEELEVHSMHLDDAEDDNDENAVSGLPPPPPIPIQARKDSLSSRRDSTNRRVSFGSHASYSPKQSPTPYRPSASPVNDTSSLRMEEELSAMGELEMLDMHEEIIDFEDDETKE
jgi:hypothetical protein